MLMRAGLRLGEMKEGLGILVGVLDKRPLKSGPAGFKRGLKMNLGGLGMFDVDQDARKAQMEKTKKETQSKSKLGAIGSPIDDKPQVISIDQVQLDRDEQWVTSFRLFANIRAAYGVEAVGGKWVIVDKTKFDKVDAVKREKLRPFWNEPL